MPYIPQTKLLRVGSLNQTYPITTLAFTTLDGSTDYFDYDAGCQQILILRNPTGGSIAPVIDGRDGVYFRYPGYGQRGVGSGYSVPSIAAGATSFALLNTISAYTVGIVDITGGGGLTAALLNTR